MAKSKEDIITEIEAHVGDRGGDYDEWYAGITEDAKRRLFTDHNVSKENGRWIHVKASSSTVARAVEKHFHALDMQGAGGGGDDEAVVVYAYKITSTTRE